MMTTERTTRWAAPTRSSGSWLASWGPAPRYATGRTPERETFGPQIRGIARLLGLDRMAHQEYVWDVLLEVQSEAAGDPNPGEWAYSTADITMPRRSGKTTLLQPVTMHRAELLRRAYIVMTAQSGKAAGRRWLDLADVIADSYMGDRVRKRVSVGHECLTWVKSLSRFEPFAPTDDAGHGDEPDLVLATEIWKWSAEQGSALDQAIRPTFLTNNAQFIRESTAGTVESAYYNGIRRLGRKAVEEGRRLGRAYFEWSIPEEVDGVSVELLPDRELIELVIAHHPRSDLDMELFLSDELEAAQLPEGEGRAGFLRAYGNYVPAVVTKSALIPADVVLKAATSQQIPTGDQIPVGLAFDLDPDGRQAAIAAAWRGDDGRAIVDVIRVELGTRWVGPAVIGIRERGLNLFPHVTVNDTAVTRDAADALEAAGIPVHRVGSKDYAAAWTRWRDETTADDPTALHHGTAALVDAIASAGTRLVGGVRVPAADGEPIATLNAAFLALWSVDHLPEPEPDLGRFKIL